MLTEIIQIKKYRSKAAKCLLHSERRRRKRKRKRGGGGGGSNKRALKCNETKENGRETISS